MHALTFRAVFFRSMVEITVKRTMFINVQIFGVEYVNYNGIRFDIAIG